MMLLLLPLQACTARSSNAQPPLDFRTALLQSGGCAFDADLTLNYGDESAQFSLRCQADLASGADLTVTAPDSISGLCAHVGTDGLTLTYDGAELGFPDLGRLTPLCAPWLLTDALAGGYLAWSGPEGETWRATYRSGYGREELQIDVWFQQNLPIRAEFTSDGELLLTAGIENFTFT